MWKYASRSICMTMVSIFLGFEAGRQNIKFDPHFGFTFYIYNLGLINILNYWS